MNIKNKSREFDSRHCIPLLFNRSLLNRKVYSLYFQPNRLDYFITMKNLNSAGIILPNDKELEADTNFSSV